MRYSTVGLRVNMNATLSKPSSAKWPIERWRRDERLLDGIGDDYPTSREEWDLSFSCLRRRGREVGCQGGVVAAIRRH